MKKVIISACLLTALTATAFAQEVKTTTPATTTSQDNDKTKVEPAALPEAVKATLGTEPYKAWTINDAWWVKAEGYYIINLKSGDKAMSVNIDKDGKVK